MKSSKKTVSKILHYSKVINENDRQKIKEAINEQNKKSVFHLNLFGITNLN